VSKETESGVILFSFNGQDYFRSDLSLTIAPDIQILDIEPKRIPSLMGGYRLIVKALYLSEKGEYECLIKNKEGIEEYKTKGMIKKV